MYIQSCTQRERERERQTEINKVYAINSVHGSRKFHTHMHIHIYIIADIGILVCECKIGTLFFFIRGRQPCPTRDFSLSPLYVHSAYRCFCRIVLSLPLFLAHATSLILCLSNDQGPNQTQAPCALLCG